MSNIVTIFISNFRRNKLMTFISLAIGLILVLGFLSLSNGVNKEDYSLSKVSIGIIDNDCSAASSSLVEWLSDTLNMTVKADELQKLEQYLIENKISAIIEIPEFMQENCIAGEQVFINIKVMDDYENSSFISSYINSYMGSIQVISQSADGDNTAFEEMLNRLEKTSVQIESAISTKSKSEHLYSIFTVMSGFFIMAMSAALVVLSNMISTDKKSGILNRMKISSVKSCEYVIGAVLYGGLCCNLSLAIFLTYLNKKPPLQKWGMNCVPHQSTNTQ